MLGTGGAANDATDSEKNEEEMGRAGAFFQRPQQAVQGWSKAESGRTKKTKKGAQQITMSPPSERGKWRPAAMYGQPSMASRRTAGIVGAGPSAALAAWDALSKSSQSSASTTRHVARLVSSLATCLPTSFIAALCR